MTEKVIDPREFRERWPSIAQIPCVGDVLDALEEAQAALLLADETFDLMDYRGERARLFMDVREDAEVAALCEKHGYGAVMDSAARLWWLKDEGRGGSFIVGSAACLVEKAARRVKEALAWGAA